jgi:hypothetical protein
MLRLLIELPELLPKIVLERMQGPITGYNSAGKWPVLRMLRQFGHASIINDIKTDLRERVALSFFFLEHVIVSLMLEFVRCEPWFEMRPQKAHAVALI